MNSGLYHLNLSSKTRTLNFFRKFFIFSGLDSRVAVLTRKNSNFSFFKKLIPPHYLYPNNEFRRCTLNGINFYIDLGDKNGHADYYGINDPILGRILNSITSGMRIYDIGGNIGTFALHFAQKVLPGGDVFSFEASPITYRYALENISRNNFSNLKLFNVGVGDKQSQVFLANVNSHNRGMSKITSDAEDHGLEREVVQIDTLDNLVVALKLPPPDVIKIDIEGYEYKALTGATRTITTHKPRMFIELDDNNLREQGNSARELVEHLRGLGYSMVNCTTLKQIHPEQDFSNCHFDIECKYEP